MIQYLNVLKNIIKHGVEKESGRANMPNTIGISSADILMDLSKGFPLLTTKKMFLKGVIHELLWFLRGDTNIDYLVMNGVNIWNGDAYRWYQAKATAMGIPEKNLYSLDEFINEIKNGYQLSTLPYRKELRLLFWNRIKKYVKFQTPVKYELGDLGKVYGYQWRNQNGVDQIKDIVEGLKKNPYSRYHILDGWQKSDFPEMALPPCHLLYQFIVRPLTTEQRWDLLQELQWTIQFEQKSTDDSELNRICDLYDVPKFYLDLNMYQRSVDSACGLPFNIASMSLLLMIIANVSNMVAGVAKWNGGDTHIYVNHIDEVKNQLKRKPYHLPTMKINKNLKTLDDILDLKFEDFELLNYESHPKINYELFVGLKK